jgi:hypothetical protein
MALKLADADIREEVLLSFPDRQIVITESHAIVCEQPFLIAVWNADLPENRRCSMIIKRQEKHLASMSLKFENTICTFNNSQLHLFRVYDCTSSLHSMLFRSYFFAKQKKKVPFRISGYYAAAYSFPRKVILTSFRSDDYFNIFPMDFQGYIKDQNAYILGLRNTNITLEKIAQLKKLAVTDFNISNPGDIYRLGKHHSSAPPSVGSLPFAVINSEIFNFPIPVFAGSYAELSTKDIVNLGSHSIIISEIVHTKQLKPLTGCLYHIDTATYLSSERYYRQHHID